MVDAKLLIRYPTRGFSYDKMLMRAKYQNVTTFENIISITDLCFHNLATTYNL